MIGKLVGHYKVARKIGDGGMGCVYEGVHEGIGRRVAIKVLHNEYSKDPNLVARFFNEAKAVNIVSHPGIVGSFDYGQLDDGTAYIVMEFIDGEPLSARIKRNRPNGLGMDALRIARQIAATLAAAHSKGIIHRDLKPDNVMIVADSEAPGGERAKVLDFGIAKIVSENDSAKLATGLTQTGAVMGTPKYMSPEQCRGTGKVDFKTDVYALGVMTYEMLAGRIPFDAEGTGAMMAMHMFQPPPSLREVDPSISPTVDGLVQSMMAKDPAARPTMLQFVAQVEQLGVKSTGVLSVVPRSAISHSGIEPIPMEFSGPNSRSAPSLLSAGQTQEPTNIRLERTGIKRLIIPIATAVVLSAVGLVLVLHRNPPPPLPPMLPATTAPAKRVVWQISTSPPGAEVVRISDGSVIGLTPWRSEEPHATGKFGVTIRRNGFLDRQVLLDRNVDCNENMQLEPVPSDKGPNPATDKPGRKSGKNPKPSKKHETSNDNSFAPVR